MVAGAGRTGELQTGNKTLVGALTSHLEHSFALPESPPPHTWEFLCFTLISSQETVGKAQVGKGGFELSQCIGKEGLGISVHATLHLTHGHTYVCLLPGPRQIKVSALFAQWLVFLSCRIPALFQGTDTSAWELPSFIITI